MTYQLFCLSLDGDKVAEGQFDTIDDALNRSQNMGSRWFFYPIHVVTGQVKIIEVPDFVETEDGLLPLAGFKGRHLKTLANFLKNAAA
jgi:hypothetical protein